MKDVSAPKRFRKELLLWEIQVLYPKVWREDGQAVDIFASMDHYQVVKSKRTECYFLKDILWENHDRLRISKTTNK